MGIFCISLRLFFVVVRILVSSATSHISSIGFKTKNDVANSWNEFHVTMGMCDILLGQTITTGKDREYKSVHIA